MRKLCAFLQADIGYRGVQQLVAALMDGHLDTVRSPFDKATRGWAVEGAQHSSQGSPEWTTLTKKPEIAAKRDAHITQ